MQTQIINQDFTDVLVAAENCANPVPQKNILVDFFNNKCVTTGTDNILYSKNQCEASVSGEARFVIDANEITRTLKKLPKGAELLVLHEDHTLTVRNGHAVFTFETQSADIFPQWPHEAASEYSSIAPGILMTLINSVQHAVANEVTHESLRGIHLDFDDNNLTAVATDGHRLALRTMSTDDINLPEHGITIPEKLAKEISKICSQMDQVEVSANEQIFSIRSSKGILSGKLVAASFPDYRSLLNQDTDKFFKADKKQFLQSVDCAGSVIASKVQPLLQIEKQEGQEVTLTAKSEKSSATDKFPAIDASENHILFGVNKNYLIDAVRSFEGATIVIKTGDQDKPVLIHSLEDLTDLQILMPMRL